MAGEKEVKAVVGYKFDPRAGNAFIQQNTLMVQSLGELQAAMTKEGVTAAEYARRSVEYIEAQNRSSAATTRFTNELAVSSQRFREKIALAKDSITTDVQQTREIERQTQALQRYNAVRSQQAGFAIDALPEPSFGAVTGTGRQQGGSFGTRRLRGLGTFGTSIRNLPDVGPTTEIANVLIGFDRITQAMGISSAAAATLGGAIAAIGVGFVALNAALEPGRVATRNFIRAIDDYTETIIFGTEATIQAAIDTARNDLTVAQAKAQAKNDEFNRRSQEIIDRFGGGQAGFAALGAALLTNAEGLNDLKAAAEASNAEVARLQTSLDYLTGSLDNIKVRIRTFADDAGQRTGRFFDALSAYLQRTFDENEERIRAQISATNDEIAFNRQLLDLRRNFSVERLSQLRQENADEQAFTREQIRRVQDEAATSKVAADELARLEIRQNQLIEQAAQLYDPYLRQLENQARILTQFSNIGAQFGRAFGALAQDLSGLDVSKQLQKIAEITKRRDERIGELEDQRREREEQAEKQYAKATAEADRKAADDRLKLFEETYKRIGDIERRFSRSFAQAVGERDALAAYQAKLQRDDDLADLKESNREREREIQRSLEREKQAAEEHRRETLQIAQDTAAKQIANERQKAQVLIDEQNRSIQQQIAQAFQFTNTLNTVFHTGYNNIISSLQSGFAGGLLNTLFGGSQNRSTSTTGGAINPPNFSYSYNAAAGVPQMITLPNGQQQQGYVVYSPTINGQNRQQTQQQMDQHTEEVLNLLYGRSAPR